MSQNSSKRNFALFVGYAVAGIVILTAASIVLGVGSFVSETKNESNMNLTSSNVDANVKSIDILDFAGTIYIERGENVSVRGKNLPKNFSSRMNGDTLEIECNSGVDFWLGSVLKNNKPVLTLTLPESFVAQKFRINIGAGELIAETISAEDFELISGAGESTIKELIADNCKIENGAGETEIKSGTMKTTNIDSGVGSTKITSQIVGDCTIKNGVGETELRIIGNKSDYYINCKNGIGTTEIDGESARNGTVGDENAKYTINAESGIGEIDIKFIR